MGFKICTLDYPDFQNLTLEELFSFFQKIFDWHSGSFSVLEYVDYDSISGRSERKIALDFPTNVDEDDYIDYVNIAIEKMEFYATSSWKDS